MKKLNSAVEVNVTPATVTHDSAAAAPFSTRKRSSDPTPSATVPPIRNAPSAYSGNSRTNRMSASAINPSPARFTGSWVKPTAAIARQITAVASGRPVPGIDAASTTAHTPATSNRYTTVGLVSNDQIVSATAAISNLLPRGRDAAGYVPTWRLSRPACAPAR